MSQPPYPPQPSAENNPARQAEPPYDPARPPHPTEPGYDPPRPPRAAAQPAYDPAFPPQPTGPMEGTFPAPPPLPGPEVSTSPRVGARPRSTADRAALTSTVLGVLGVVLLVVGLSLGEFGVSLWSATTAWAVFATLSALVALVPAVPGRGGLSRQQAWLVGAAGAGGVTLFWLLVVVLTGAAASDRGFLLTLATGLVAGGIWLHRRDL